MSRPGNSPTDADAGERNDEVLRLVEVWYGAAGAVVALLRSLDEDEWRQPTDLPGWNVRAVAAHLAHLESELAGNPQEQVAVPDAAHVKGPLARFTEAGPVARAGWSTSRIVDELESSVAKRYAELLADPPPDPTAAALGFAALAGWSWATLLSNRPFDVWMHEQDIRRAIDRPGGLDSPAAAHVAEVLASSLPFVLAKRAAAPAGTTLVLEVTDAQPRRIGATVGADGRGAPLADPPVDPTARIVVDFESWIVLAGGRRRPEQVPVTVSGDRDLAHRVLAGLAVTP